MDLDDILPEIGEYGRYQKSILWLVLLPGVFPCGFHAYNQLFMAATPEHWCKVPELKQIQSEESRNLSVPLELVNGVLKYSECKMYDRNYTDISLTIQDFDYDNDTVQIDCKNGWIFDKSLYKQTVVMEWNLVCSKDFYPTLALVLFGIGGLIGNYIFGYIQDGFGRKPAFFSYLLIQCIFGIATAFAPNFWIWLTFRFGVGLTVPAILGTPYVLAIELVGPKYRTLVTILINISYSLALVSLALVVWLVTEWRLLALVTTAPFFVLFSFWCLLPESPRWLLAQSKFSAADSVISKIAKINGKPLPTNYINLLKIKIAEEQRKKPRSKKSYGISDLFRTPNLRWKTIIITFIWFTNTSVYVGLSYYAPALGGDAFLNFFLAAAVELPTYLFLWPAMENWGRRWCLCASMVIGGSACLSTFLVQHNSMVTLGLYCVGKMGISSSYVVLPLMASELYPTVVRGLGISVSTVIGMIGPVIIPLVNYLGSDMLTLPLIIMGTMLVLGGLSSLLLPETLNQHLPQTLEDAEKTGLDCGLCFNVNQ
ncbi:beta-alanine transporter [Onthophagus taurus]|uniref:beta-alanine transporter n=1 Tax=Onthophagus taurus TaxID=166361 RepID=UPI0039BE3F6D